MIAILAAAIVWRMGAVDRAWARIAQDAAARDAGAFAADRAEIARLDQALLTDWGARRRESYEGPGYAVVTYSGPTRVRGDRGRSAYFAVVTPTAELAPPTFWEVTPGFSPLGGAVWTLSVSGCDLASGDPKTGHPRSWRTPGPGSPPAYEAFKATLKATAETAAVFPADTTTAHTPGTTCLYVGDLSTEHLFPPPTSTPGLAP